MGWHAFSVFLVIIAVFMPVIIAYQAHKKLEYQNSVEAIQAVASKGSQPTFFISANQYTHRFIVNSTEEARLVSDYVEISISKADSLGLTADKRLGLQLEISAVPCGLFGKRHVAVKLKLYSSYCGCDTDSLIDETVLQINESGMEATVISSNKVALADIQP
ncbi:MAG: hypothetical protein ABIJ12_13835 [bacterium]